ncbi:MAG: hypothetical protein KTR25_14955 [Myxococcales bacterium]|nr:hypothetical protein [Myxococcales bacterium]
MRVLNQKHFGIVSSHVLLAATTLVGVVSPARAAMDVEAEYTFFSQNETTVHSPEFGVQFTTGQLAFRGRWGFANSNGFFNNEEKTDDVVFFNPYFNVLHTFDIKILTLRLGVGASIPLSNPDRTNAINIARANIATRGGYNAFMYAPQTFGLTATAEAELNVGPIQVAGDITPIALFSTANVSSDADGVGFQAGAQAMLPLLGIAGIGLRIQTAVLPEAYASSDAQVAIEPFVEASIAGLLTAHAGLWMNLTEPYGFAFDSDGFYGLNFGLSLSL